MVDKAQEIATNLKNKALELAELANNNGSLFLGAFVVMVIFFVVTLTLWGYYSNNYTETTKATILSYRCLRDKGKLKSSTHWGKYFIDILLTPTISNPCYINIEYTIPGCTKYHGTLMVPKAVCMNKEVEIMYDPDNPFDAVLSDELDSNYSTRSKKYLLAITLSVLMMFLPWVYVILQVMKQS